MITDNVILQLTWSVWPSHKLFQVKYHYRFNKVGCRCYVRLDLLRQFKTDLVRQLEGLIFEKKSSKPNLKKLKVEIRINRTKSVSKLCSINVLFDQYHVGKKFAQNINRTKFRHKFSSTNANFDFFMYWENDLFFRCRTKSKELSKTELLNVTPDSTKWSH